MITFFIHQILFLITKPYYIRFKKESLSLKENQHLLLKSITGFDNPQNYQEKFPITNYDDYKVLFEELRKNNTEKHFIPTSGSTNAIKWIPYTSLFKKELFKASSVWIHDLYLRYPKLKSGKHYWSLSWLPKDLRKSQSTSDVDLFIGLEKWCLSHSMAINDSVMETDTLKESMLQTLVILLNKKITLISIWSPTFLIEMLDLLVNEKDFFLDKVIDPQKKKRIATMVQLNPVVLKSLFPDLIVISCWDSSSSAYYADQLKSLFNFVTFEGKGLWTTEGVITFPLAHKNVLAYQSHFFEFKEFETQKIYFSWELKKGMLVSPIITTGSGLKRYLIDDLCEVSAIENGLPLLQFKVRLGTTDLVGEKISTQIAEMIIQKLNEQFNCKAICLIAHQVDQPYYEMLIDNQSKAVDLKSIQIELENLLNEHFHYKLARELNQLSSSQVRLEEHAHLTYIKIKGNSVKVLGDIKFEPLVLNNPNKMQVDIL